MTSEATLVVPLEVQENAMIFSNAEALPKDHPTSEQAEDSSSVTESIASAFKRIMHKPFSLITSETGAGADANASSSHAVILMPPEKQDEMPEELYEERELEQQTQQEKQSEQLKHSDSMQTLTIHGRHSHITTTYVDHCHRERAEGIDRTAARKLIVASILCVFFMTCEIIGGVLSNSLAIATDAAHLLTDLAGFLISLFALYLAGRASTERFNFGWHRAEVIGAMISVYFIWLITGILVWIAAQRMIAGSHQVDAVIMLITSALAIVFNLVMAFQLSHGHSHGHRQSHLKVQSSSHQLTTENLAVS
ncbi:zinc transporter 2 [Drosophila innubila]|uniref:zinc transporter 2 n=1 Tax=Drosophila innubila TaxID=198719 RepID=UPI00148D42BD|nr:zinc transporter 2 [Drosophila innubila]